MTRTKPLSKRAAAAADGRLSKRMRTRLRTANDAAIEHRWVQLRAQAVATGMGARAARAYATAEVRRTARTSERSIQRALERARERAATRTRQQAETAAALRDGRRTYDAVMRWITPADINHEPEWGILEWIPLAFERADRRVIELQAENAELHKRVDELARQLKDAKKAAVLAASPYTGRKPTR